MPGARCVVCFGSFISSYQLFASSACAIRCFFFFIWSFVHSFIRSCNVRTVCAVYMGNVCRSWCFSASTSYYHTQCALPTNADPWTNAKESHNAFTLRVFFAFSFCCHPYVLWVPTLNCIWKRGAHTFFHLLSVYLLFAPSYWFLHGFLYHATEDNCRSVWNYGLKLFTLSYRQCCRFFFLFFLGQYSTFRFFFFLNL